MVILLRRNFGLMLVGLLLIGSLSVDSRSHRGHRLSRDTASTEVDKADIKADDGDSGEDYDAMGDERYVEDEFLNDDDGNDDDDDLGEDYEPSEEVSSGGTTVPVVILSKSSNITADLGETIFLPCEVSSEKNSMLVIIWKKDEQVLFQGDLRVTKDSRIHRYNNLTMSISNINSSDYGTYSCMVMVDKVMTIIHRVRAPMAPKIVEMLPKGRDRLVVEGQSLKIQCRVEGDPKPQITWTKKGSRLTKDDVEFGDQYIFIEKVTRVNSGMYQCLASSKIGAPVVDGVDIKVLHAPEVHLKKTVVNTEEGYEAQMLCSVKSEPRATIIWERNGEAIRDSRHHHIILHKDGDHSMLRIMKVEPSDFGRYVCKAHNEYGMSEAHLRLVKVPGRAVWVSGSQEPSQSSPVLQWAVESIQPITDVELHYYKIDETNPNNPIAEESWVVVRPDITQPTGNVYTLKHPLRGLTPGKYTARLRAKNSNGWSEVSEQHMFDGDYETNFVTAEIPPQPAPIAEVGSGSSINTRVSSVLSTAAILFSMAACRLVQNN